MGTLTGGEAGAEGILEPHPLLRATIGQWRDSLINLSGTNRLLSFRVTKTGAVRVIGPAGADILVGLSAGRDCRFRAAEEPLAHADGEWAVSRARTSADRSGPVDVGADRRTKASSSGHVLHTDKPAADLAAALRNLLRRSNQEFLDRGLWILYLAFGSLTWTDGDKAPYTSPLLLVPVRLVSTGPRHLPTLEVADEDPVINPALVLKLGQLAIVLPAVDELEDISYAELLATVRAAVAEQSGWRVNDEVTLSYFSFAKEAMYRDLLDNEDLIAEHAGVRALATGGRGSDSGEFLFEELTEEQVDLKAPAERTPLVLDADSSQRASVAAALAGRSFVMDGPPGTGKSQTIANMIGALLHAGKRVLFVSEKAAALEVVRNRLHDIGLGAYLLELHSHKATRKEVAAALGQALETVPVAPGGMSDLDLDDARRRREELNAYAEAMNMRRAPLNWSLHDVLGMIANLHDVPAAPASGIAPVDLTVEVYGRLRGTAAALARAWRPAAQGRSFVWRGVTHHGSLDARLYAASSALETLAAVGRPNVALADAFDVGRLCQAPTFAQIVAHVAARPAGLPEPWLAAASLDATREAADRLGADLREITVRQSEATRAAGVPWRRLPAADTVATIDTSGLEHLDAPALHLDSLTGEQAASLAATFDRDAGMLQARLRSLSGLAILLGLPPVVSFDDAEATLALVTLGRAEDRPERAWLSAAGLAAATQAAQALRQAIAALHQAETAAAAHYTGDLLTADVEGLAHRFTHEHRGLKKLGGAYRTDKRSLAAITRASVDRRQARDHLGEAVAWKRAAAVLADAEARHAAALGAYYAGRFSDFDRLARALATAGTAIGQARTADLGALADHIARDANPNVSLFAVADESRALLQEWRSRLAPEPVPAARPELVLMPLADAAGWLLSHRGPLQTAAEVADAVSRAVGKPLTIDESRCLLQHRATVDAAYARLAAHEESYQQALGLLYTGEHTGLDAVHAAIGWTAQLRTCVTGSDCPLTAAQADAVGAAAPTPRLADAVLRWTGACADLLAAFETSRKAELMSELDDYADSADLLASLRDDTAGQDEWFAYQDARADLTASGLETAIDFCIAEGVPAERVPLVIDRALLQEWADHHLHNDDALKLVRAEDRDALVAEYRSLDRALIAAATSRIITACNAKRPRNNLGESAVIQREASKKRKHMPVRLLLERTRHVTQAIKPCFMMSPLAVSQYLPSDLRFDVVIFDEASQVAPADAINCIYRGDALITAGDQKQLPPTSFFTAGVADDADEWDEEAEDGVDFESVLDLMKGSGAFRSLTLRWHYRSRHEALIAFSNSSFYDGRLITFPGPETVGPDVGVEMFPVHGTYRRGSSRDNPIEAARVAERVIHHFTTRPHLSLGVVSFSEAQAATIEYAVEQARQQRPDLDGNFTDDRLGGFFVKSLESVQGDERDVMIFSIGYGPDEAGKTTMNFGPLNRSGGWRRLNVAVTRARHRNEIVASVQASDITAAATSDGLRHLRRYLDYAARGVSALALDTSTGGDAESPFEESVISVVRSWGYELTPQVGTAGYRIDMGVRHPDRPGVYVLGVECDGFQYHSSKVARDRDRLRDEVLRGLGWRLHRIWGTAWYRNRNGEEDRLRAAIEAAVAAPIRGLLTRPDDRIDRPAVTTQIAALDARPTWVLPYQTAQLDRLPSWIDPGEYGSSYEMRAGVAEIAAIEGPVHVNVVHQRLRDAWAIGRIGPRIRDNIDAAIRLAGLDRNGDFLTVPGSTAAVVRSPIAGCTRTVEQISDDELSLALTNLVRDTGGVSPDELCINVAKLYGWTRRGPDITNRLATLTNRLVGNGELKLNGQSLTTTA
jgi:very-short-patch-repair endonuclease